MSDSPLTGAILAGGGSTRMRQSKHAMILPNGRSMIETVADAMSPLCDRMVVVGPAEALPVLDHVADLRDAQGPLAGIEALLASESPDTTFLICACDTPFVTAELLQLLLTVTDRPATFLSIGGEADPEPLPARIHASALSLVQSMLDDGHHALHQFIKRVEHGVVSVPDAFVGQLTNVNTPREFEQASARFDQ